MRKKSQQVKVVREDKLTPKLIPNKEGHRKNPRSKPLRDGYQN